MMFVQKLRPLTQNQVVDFKGLQQVKSPVRKEAAFTGAECRIRTSHKGHSVTLAKAMMRQKLASPKKFSLSSAPVIEKCK